MVDGEFQTVCLLHPQHLLIYQSSGQIANGQPYGEEKPSNDKVNRFKKSFLEGLMGEGDFIRQIYDIKIIS